MPLEPPVGGPAPASAEPPTERLSVPAQAVPGPGGASSQAHPAEAPGTADPGAPVPMATARADVAPSQQAHERDTVTMTLPVPPGTPPTELRVHGVSGTPAEEMLDRPLIVQVAGDGEAGFFRPRTEYGATLGPGGARLEAYRWGNLTAGAAARAFWLLLLPFTLANVAMWLRPPATGFGRRIVHGLCRLFAVSMSATLTLSAVGIFLDLVAWQCAGSDRECATSRPWLSFFVSGFFAPTGRRLALAALGPIIVVSFLWFLAVRSWSRYESYKLPQRNADGDGLATPTFWDGRDQVGRLRSLHIAAMFATIDAVLLYVLVGHDLNHDAFAGVDLRGFAPDAVVGIGRGLGVVVVAILVLCAVLLLLPPIVERVSKSTVASVVAQIVRLLALLATLATLAYAMLPRADWSAEGPLPGYAGTVTKLFTGQTAVLALMALVVLFQRHRAKGAILGGFGTPIVASLSLGLGAAMAAGVSYRFADFLDGGGTVPSPSIFSKNADQQHLQPPLQYQWAAAGFILLVVVTVLAVLWNRLVTKSVLRRRARKDIEEDYPGGHQRDKARAATLDEAVADAKLTDHVSGTFGIAWFVVAASGAVATGFALFHVGLVDLATSGSTAAEVLSVVVNTGVYLINVAVLGLILLGVQTYRNARVRRSVGIIWDLATFWPRAAHPLAPPCYAERVVPELVYRSTWLATEQGGLVLSGHSQGSILVVATILQLPEPARRRTALITYGSPLCRLYLRAFPTYFNEVVLNDIGAAVAGPRGQERWVNLWRRTDPIGGAVGIGDRRLADPVSFDPVPGDRIPPAVKAHSGYQLTPQFGQAMDDLVGLLRQ
jgi:hypothetical protein